MKWKRILGWSGVSITVVFSSLWAYWGAFENFHEGCYASFLENIFMFFFQYLLFAIIFTVLALISLKWKKAGLLLHLAVSIFCAWFFAKAAFSVLWLLIIIPFAVLAVCYHFGEPYPLSWAYRLILFIPLTIVLAISIPQGIKVANRIDDGDLGVRTIEDNGVSLAFAPRGPGWPDEGVTWEEAQTLCSYLSEDGLTIMDSKQNIWRLPTVDEAVRSMMLHGENAGGIWYAQDEKAVYEKTPDKESPLWDVHSKIIYYWTADTSVQDPKQAYIIVYNGGVYDKRKTDRLGYLSFRAVKDL
ncbi:MAG TPA: DUF1566 domain-containing protein [Lachnospiraceae bacterium]|nr:DUF1566 domain-containing protein [Lachnospiraceae bacterium]